MTSCELATYDISGNLAGIYVRLLGVRSRGEEIDPGDTVNSDIAVARSHVLIASLPHMNQADLQS